jgi:plastocyanin
MMRGQQFIVGSALIILTGCQHSLVRDNIPTMTRTGEVKDVVIQDSVSPTFVTAMPGDEIRWINKRDADVQVTVISPVNDQLACQRNFSGRQERDRNQYTAKVERNDTAAVCFRDPTELNYVVRTESGDPNGAHSILGTIRIATGGQTPQTATLTSEEGLSIQ